MRKFLAVAFTIANIVACSKDNVSDQENPIIPQRYQAEVFSTVNVVQNIKYGQAKPSNGSGLEDLLLDLYTPAGDTSSSRPLMIGVHGGGFIAGDKQQANWPEICKAFAKRGYVAASINYRLGRNTGEEYEPAWRAQQDLKAAIRFARAHAAAYKINVNKIYIMGSSAGGATCLITAYMDANEAPASINQSVWGNIEGNSGNPGYSSSIAGLVSMWGGVNDTLGITGTRPVGLVHSLNDPTSPYYSKYDPVRDVTTYGSYAINQRAKNVGIKTDLKTYYFNGHDDGLYPPYLDSTIKFCSDFLYQFVK